MPIIRFGLDLAKNSIAIYGVNEHEKMVVRKTLKREKLVELFANVPPALIAMDAGSGAHHLPEGCSLFLSLHPLSLTMGVQGDILMRKRRAGTASEKPPLAGNR